MRKETLGLLSLVLIGLILTVQALSNQTSIHSVGTVKTLGDLETDVSSIDWGLIDPNSTETRFVNVRVTGNTPATLSLDAQNWSPLNASSYMSLSWNYTGATLDPLVWTPLELYLYVVEDIEGITSFSFDIIIYAED